MKFLDYFKRKTKKIEEENKKLTISDVASKSPENPINKQEKVRVIYANAFTFETGYDSFKKFGIDLTIGNPLVLPEGISLEESYSILSKVIDDNMAKENSNIEETILGLGRQLFDYGFTEIKTTLSTTAHQTSYIPGPFKTVNINTCPEIEGVTDLLIVDGNSNLFNKTNIASRKSNWYDLDVTQEKIDQIYSKRKEQLSVSQDK